MEKKIETRCLVIGSGIAGLSAAIVLAEKGVDTVVITAASSVVDSNTALAQGGIVYLSQSQDPEKLMSDIVEAGGGLNFVPAVEKLVEQGPRLVKKLFLEKVDIPFEKNMQGELNFTREAAHSEKRIIYCGDESGKTIEEALYRYSKTFSHIHFLTSTTAVNLLMTSYHSKDRSSRHSPVRCFGAFVYDQKSFSVYPIFSEHTILATGGVGQLYLHSTNSDYARGDGIALAYRAGCRLSQLEFLQFHPTTFYHQEARRFLISETVRGEGGVLVNHEGQRFLNRFLPSYKIPELAPRDKVSWAINQEMISSGIPCVYLDISHKSSSWIRERFPFIFRSCLEYGVDMTKEPIPVVPGAHYHIGGVWTDLEGRTSVANLWAAGEVASTGLHGVNRLASTSLLEGLVWGYSAGEQISGDLYASKKYGFPEIDPWVAEPHEVDSSFLKQDWLMLKHTMWNYVGLIKTSSRLDRAEGIIKELLKGIDVFYRKAALSDALIGLRHAALVAWLILDACRKNPVSQGCYLRDEEIEI